MATIYSAQSNQQQILVDIATLHNGGRPFDLDAFYGNGSFWTGVAEPLKPRLRMDLFPVWKASKASNGEEYTEVNVQADARALPFGNGSLSSICADPPFVHAAGASSIMGQRFGSYPSQIALRQMYWRTFMQFQSALMPGGLLVVKCQDIVESGKQNWNHLDVMTNLRTMGIPVIDLFVLVRQSAVAGHNHQVQYHARRNHSYFVVARKESRLPPTPKPIKEGGPRP